LAGTTVGSSANRNMSLAAGGVTVGITCAEGGRAGGGAGTDTGAGAGGGAGADTGAGSVIGTLHRGQRTVFPRSSSDALRTAAHWGQETFIGMGC
jgi:hypothetical protein